MLGRTFFICAVSCLPALALLCLPAGCSSEEHDPFVLAPDTPVILIIIDTLRADHLSCYGYELDTSPVLDEFAAGAYLFEENTTQFNSTFPSILSIFTGLYPRTHGSYLPVPLAESTQSSQTDELLSSRFKARGYHTMAVVSHPLWGNRFLMQGWDRFSRIEQGIPLADRRLYSHAEYTNKRLFELLDAYEKENQGQPLFVWAHYFDPHTDLRGLVYNTPKKTRNLFLEHHMAAVGQPEVAKQLAPLNPEERYFWIRKIKDVERKAAVRLGNGRALYDGEIRFCDAGIGAFFDRLERMGLFDRSLIVVMADHGENMEGTDRGHGEIAFTHMRLFEGVARTPLIIKLPGQKQGKRIGQLTQNIDVTATIIDLLGLRDTPEVEGRSLVPLMRDPGDPLHEKVFIESSDGVERAVKTEQLKYIAAADEQESLLYHWRKDRDELNNLLGRIESKQVQALAQVLEEFRPFETIRIRMMPGVSPYDVDIEIRMPESKFEQVAGAPETALSDEQHCFSWSGSVGERPVDLFLKRRHSKTEIQWRIDHGKAPDCSEKVWLGRTPLRETPAIPIWKPGSGDPPPNPLIVLDHIEQEHAYSIKVTPHTRQTFEWEMRYAKPFFKKEFKILSMEGFQPNERKRSNKSCLTYRGTGEARASVQHYHDDSDVYHLLRVDGAWPDPGTVVVNGRSAANDALEFVFPFPPLDFRIMGALETGPMEDPPPGSIVIWLESGVSATPLDTDEMDPEMVEQLRTLGYIK